MADNSDSAGSNSAGRNIVGRGLEVLALALAGLSAFGLAAIVGLIIASVAMRKLLNAPLYFSEEIVGLLMSSCLFLALPMVTLRNSHVRVSVIAGYLEKRNQTLHAILSCLAAMVGVACCAWLTIEAVPWLQFAIDLNLKTETSRVLLYPWMAALPVSVALTGFIFVSNLTERLKRLFGRQPGGTGY